MRLNELFHTYTPENSLWKKPLIIAEAGVNHEGDIDLAKRLIDEACEGGADAIKFQTYKAETIASQNSPSYWDLKKEPTTSQYQLFQKYDKFWKKEFEELKQHCDKVGIEFLSTPFDLESARFLNDLMDVFKISSSDITNKPFIEYICGFNKPILLSTGAANLEEVREAVGWISQYGNSLSLLHCVLNYPTSDCDANLGMILGLRKHFPNTIIGYSDHTLPGHMKNLSIASLLGAVILEKHFTYDKTLPGNDHYHAMDKEDLKELIVQLDALEALIGNVEVTALPVEKIARQNARRSLVAQKDIPAGKVIDAGDVTWKRPGTGISPKEIEKVIGAKAQKTILQDEILGWDMLQ